MKRRYWLIASLGVVCLLLSNLSYGQGQPILKVRGLEEFTLIDQWTIKLSQQNNSEHAVTIEKSESDLIKQLMLSICLSGNEGCQPTLTEIEKKVFYMLARPYDDGKSYVVVAKTLISLRRALVEGDYGFNLDEKRKITLLLQIFAEEALYAGKTKFPEQVSDEFVWQPEQPSNALRTITFNGLTIPNGAIMGSKGTTFSSAMIQFYGDIPGVAAHSYQVWVDPNDSSQALVSESLIETGVRLNSIHAFEAFHPVYAPKDFAQQLSYSSCVDSWVDKMTVELADKISSPSEVTAQSYLNPENASFTCYDFSFNPTHNDMEQCYACTTWLQFTQDMCKQAGQDIVTPYPQAYWNKSTGVLADFYMQTMGVASAEFPNPSDIEFNPDFSLVAARIDTSTLDRARVSQAAIDALLFEVEDREPRIRQIMQWTAEIGNEKTDPEKLRAAITAFDFATLGLDAEEAEVAKQQALENVTLVPEGATYKQVALFAWLNFSLQKNIEQVYDEQYRQKGVLLGPVALRQALQMIIRVGIETELKPAIKELAKQYAIAQAKEKLSF